MNSKRQTMVTPDSILSEWPYNTTLHCL